MVHSILVFIVSLYLVIKGSTMATTHAGKLAETFRLSTYAVGFIVVAVISILPETFIALNAALTGVPSFGLGMLFGSNVADLTLIFAILVWYAGRSLKVESKILKNHVVYPFILLFPLVLGIDGFYSRIEGAALVVAGAIFYYLSLRAGADETVHAARTRGRAKHLALLVLSMAVLLIGAHFTVSSATMVAHGLGVSPILVGLLVVGLGTTMPELFFSLKSVKRRDDSLAIGDLLGTVLADATIVVGLIALVQPFAFPQKIVFVTGAFMVLSSFVLFRFMRSGRSLARREALLLFATWLAFVVIEFLAGA